MANAKVSVIERPKPPEDDTQAPIVESTNPSAGQIIDSGSLTKVWAVLKEKPDSGASGIDFARSEIFLVDKTGQKRGGHQENDGINKIFWVLDVPLDNSSPGSYTIKVRPVDVKGNDISADYQKFEFIMKDIIVPDVSSLSPLDGSIVISPFSGPIEVYLSEIARGDSGIDWDNSSLSLKKEYATIPIVQSHYVTPNTNNNAGKLIGSLSQTLLDDGTYTIDVKAYDLSGNLKSASYNFYLKTIIPFITNPQPPDGSIWSSPYTGSLSAWLSEEEGGWGIDWSTSTITLQGPEGNIALNITSEPGTSALSGKIIATPKSPLYPAGTYYWTVRACDYQGHSMSSLYTFTIKIVQPIIQNPYPTNGVKAPYSGIISVEVSVSPGDPDLNTTTLTLSLKKNGANIPLQTTYQGDARKGTLIGTPTSPLTEEGQYTIYAEAKDINGNLGSGQFSFNLVWFGPSIEPLTLSSNIFSPYTSLGECDTITITFKADEDGTYNITVDERALANAQGAYTKGSLTSYIWDGKDVNNGTFTSGTHTIMVSLTNFGGKTGTASAIITIDSTPPNILSLFADDYRFSPGTSTGIEDTTKISFSISEDGSYSLTIDGTQTVSGALKKDEIGLWIWNGAGFGEGSHTIELRAKDGVANLSTSTISIYIDNTPPIIESIIDNTGGRKFFRDEMIILVLKPASTDTLASAKCILGPKEIPLTRKEGMWQGSYRVTASDVGAWRYKGEIIDEAGNPGANNDTFFGTITLDGEKLNPITLSRIARLGIIPEKKEERVLSGLTIAGSTTDTMTIKWVDEKGLIEGQAIEIRAGNYIWITTFKNKKAIISNAELYYGDPIIDYTKINPESSYSLKDTLKKGDKLIISLTAVRVENIIPATISVKTLNNIIITSPEIKLGGSILVSDNIHTWLQEASQDGSFTISNQNLYAGELIVNYNDITGSLVVEEVNWASGGEAAADLGVYLQGIQLADEGISDDRIAGDGIYSGSYEVKETNNISSVPLYGHFRYNKQKAENDVYIDERLKISLDGIAPVISNANATPSPFNPEKENCFIEYHLSEDSLVSISIYKYGTNELIRTIIPFSPKAGENVSDFWDGRDSMGNRVSEGHYFYTIDAQDRAGNEAEQKTGNIVVTYIKIKIKDLIISPQPFLPSDESALLIKFRVVLEGSNEAIPSDSQLNNLGFDFKAYPAHLNFPYSLLKLRLFAKDIKEISLLDYPDMSPGRDIDPWLWDMPNYGGYDKGSLAVTSGDEDTGNDYGNLVPFFKDKQGNYYYDYEFAIKNWKNPAGLYIFQAGADLVSICWEQNPPESNKWHAKPYQWEHLGLHSDAVSCQFDVLKEPTPPAPDTTPPSLSASYPASSDSKNPGVINEIWARLEDNTGGVGVDFDQSTIRLYDSNNQEITGTKTVIGVENKIYLYLSSSLANPGNYNIKVYAVDKNGNSANYSITFS
ncbi:MAG: hypothetical protein AB1297_03565, partial [bacterium]